MSSPSFPRHEGDEVDRNDPPPLPPQVWMEPLLPASPLHPADRERGHFDIRGFLAGFVISSAIGAVLYIYLTAG